MMKWNTERYSNDEIKYNRKMESGINNEKDSLYQPFIDCNGWLRTDSQSDSRDTTKATDKPAVSRDADAG